MTKESSAGPQKGKQELCRHGADWATVYNFVVHTEQSSKHCNWLYVLGSSIPELSPSCLKSVQPWQLGPSGLKWVVTTSTTPHVQEAVPRAGSSWATSKLSRATQGPATPKQPTKLNAQQYGLASQGQNALEKDVHGHCTRQVGSAVQCVVNQSSSKTQCLVFYLLIDLKCVEPSQGEKCQTGVP